MSQSTTAPPEQLTELAAGVSSLRTGLASVITGHPQLIDTTIAVLLAGGHILIEDVPGVGKTTLAKALGRLIDTKVGRIQFTPDLLPSDVTGVTIFHGVEGQSSFRPGPVFANIVIADEINRASPKAQSALLECMAERQVTVDGETYPLPGPFLVVATQNPLEMEGTYPLPEAQRDRFMARLDVGYPSYEAELQMLEQREAGDPLDDLQPVLEAATISRFASLVRRVYVTPSLKAYLVQLVAATRQHPMVRVGASPRATLQLTQAARALAATRARNFVVPDDIQAIALQVLAHRIVMSPTARAEGVSASDVVSQVLATVSLPPPTTA
ncbi:MoxR family ATPase [Rarobacter faecitabidus]|uniref:MoxR-like ATPase n=1 Tax=Rarobacter faecitabidus TaxID=13243 RepID=A0A542Z8J7_RARFA|nr:MoxR family ATPase [Rarobacter faecitabidus]TQL56668.1 MoxR-like ATPase [Rarobacter faecitabidus]